jgi:hypothetical protein
LGWLLTTGSFFSRGKKDLIDNKSFLLEVGAGPLLFLSEAKKYGR